jgi:hypothetical protein
MELRASLARKELYHLSLTLQLLSFQIGTCGFFAWDQPQTIFLLPMSPT